MMSTEVIDQDLIVRGEHDQGLVKSRLRSDRIKRKYWILINDAPAFRMGPFFAE